MSDVGGGAGLLGRLGKGLIVGLSARGGNGV